MTVVSKTISSSVFCLREADWAKQKKTMQECELQKQSLMVILRLLCFFFFLTISGG